jgi:hypothetical protein
MTAEVRLHSPETSALISLICCQGCALSGHGSATGPAASLKGLTSQHSDAIGRGAPLVQRHGVLAGLSEIIPWGPSPLAPCPPSVA